ncbi:uncharacterized protein LOC120941707 isoform X2 [Rana temporaria]|uniref:uncharacterized protein LOC120941707 isoform X2 n=1 Tax=Rana temporaria TaxID=8407 RepID=UPI001AAC54EB|nr:uncharacterized protein LOC120941707 isoform X2 [Rana temporaria]
MAGAPETGTERGLSMVEDRKGSLLEKLNKYTSSTEKVGPLTIYKRKIEQQSICKFKTVQLNKKSKVIMMVGETGSGKTTLINTMVNYIFGVEWKDDHRIKLIEESSGKSQAHSQTLSVALYQIHQEDGFRIPYTITIIDTPGFGDTRGIDHDEKIMKKIREFFSKCKFTEIDAICFVVQSSLARLTPTQVYIYDNILSIFGKDIKDNIVFFTTFADFEEPNVLSAITEADVPCAKSKDGKPVYFMVNNSMLYANNRPGEVGKRACKAQEMQWEVGMESIEKFFLQYLPELASKDLTLTKEVLAKRNALEVSLDGLVQKFEEVTGKQHELEQTERILNEHRAEVEKNRDYEYEVTETVKRKVDSSEYSVNCRNCSSTCHQDCNAFADFLVYLCGAFNWKGICRVCKHGTKRHFLEKSCWKTFVETRKETYFDIKEKYENAKKKEMTLEDVLSEIKKDITKKEDELLKITQEIAEILKLLQEIALKPNPVSAVDYMKLLIEKEKREGKAGFLERIKIMEGNIKKFENISKISSGKRPN